ncbi:hypothetical protein ACTA71_004696 [Dictyostelium dimigraforme]
MTILHLFKKDCTKNKTQNEYFFKILIVGDRGVGKSSILSKFSEDLVKEETYMSIIGTNFKIKTVYIDGKTIKLQIFEAMGDVTPERQVNSSNYRGTSGVLIVYDCTNPISYKNLPNWIEQIQTFGLRGVCKTIVGNKGDIVSNKVVDPSKARKYANSQGMKFFETSAKEATNIEEAFISLAQSCIEFHRKIEWPTTRPRPHICNGGPHVCLCEII